MRLPITTDTIVSVAPPGFCNRGGGGVRYGSIEGLEYEVPQARLYQRGSLLDGLAMYLSCDTKKFHDNESTHILHNFWTSTHRGGSFSPSPPGGATEAELYCGLIIVFGCRSAVGSAVYPRCLNYSHYYFLFH